MTEQVLDLKGSLGLLRRRWWIVLAFVVAGLAGSVGYLAATPPAYTADSLVLLPVGSGVGTPSANHTGTTDARIATSAAVLGPARREVGSTLSLRELQQRVSAAPAATSVLRITATASTRAQAEAIANAVAGQLVSFVATSGSTASSGVVAGLQAEAAQLKSQAADVQTQLTAARRQAAAATTAGARAQASGEIAKLTAQAASLTLQLNTVNSQIAQAELQSIGSDRGVQVLQRATSATSRSVASLLLPLLAGALAGLLVGSLFVLARYRKDRSLWTRDAVAGAVGAPVVASLDVPRRRSLEDWGELLEHYTPSALEQWTMRRVLRTLGVTGTSGTSDTVVRAVAMHEDLSGAAAAVHLALAASALGTHTVLVVHSATGDLTALRAACARYDGREVRPGLAVRDAEQAERNGALGAELPDLTVVLTSVDGSGHVPAPPVSTPSATTTIVSVGAGHATAEQLAAVAIAFADAGSPLAGIVLANPLAGDQTVGRFVDAKARPVASARRPALRARSETAAARNR